MDIQGIVAVVYMEQPYGLVDFAQQTGHGRQWEGKVVESVVVAEEDRGSRWGSRSDKAWHGDIEEENQQAMARFLNSTGYRQVELGRFMDGIAGDCKEVGGVLYD